ncbi:hypothetical protein pb186bvf_017445 [Paramecium bursaria]
MSDDDLKYDQSTKPSENQEDDAQEVFPIEKQKQNPQRLQTYQSPSQHQNHAQREFKSQIPINVIPISVISISVIPNSQIKTPPNIEGFSLNSNTQQIQKQQKTTASINSSQNNSDKSIFDFDVNDQSME